MTDAAELAAAPRAFVAAAAGCGKTHLISEAVCRFGTRRDLVLTHTHAGVQALRNKIQRIENRVAEVAVETIAAWALRYASAFPKTSGLQTQQPKTNLEWNCVYAAARKILLVKHVRDVLKASYSGVYVDEYQDCSTEQHALLLALADAIPTRLLGDPLQGIFDFGQNRPVNWELDVCANFAELSPITRPWRWETKNPQLGQWLASARQALLRGHPIHLDYPVRWVRLLSANPIGCQVSECVGIARREPGSVVAIHNVANQVHYLAGRLLGFYQCAEPIELEDLFQNGMLIETSHGPARAAAVIDFAEKCMTRVGPALRQACNAYRLGDIPRTRAGLLADVHGALRRVAEDDSLSTVIDALTVLRHFPNAIMYRRELFNEMVRGLRASILGSNVSLQDSLWIIRNRSRFSGRRVARCVVGTTLLVKGLEFDHAIILNAEDMDLNDLYVALTRGSRSLTVFSSAQTLTPMQRRNRGTA